jgi:hypothetical protein
VTAETVTADTERCFIALLGPLATCRGIQGDGNQGNGSQAAAAEKAVAHASVYRVDPGWFASHPGGSAAIARRCGQIVSDWTGKGYGSHAQFAGAVANGADIRVDGVIRATRTATFDLECGGDTDAGGGAGGGIGGDGGGSDIGGGHTVPHVPVATGPQKSTAVWSPGGPRPDATTVGAGGASDGGGGASGTIPDSSVFGASTSSSKFVGDVTWQPTVSTWGAGGGPSNNNNNNNDDGDDIRRSDEVEAKERTSKSTDAGRTTLLVLLAIALLILAAAIAMKVLNLDGGADSSGITAKFNFELAEHHAGGR